MARRHEPGDWMVEIAINATEVVTLKAPMTQPFGTWTHVAGVYDPSGPVLRLYLNGVLAGELTEGVPAAQYTGRLLLYWWPLRNGPLV